MCLKQGKNEGFSDEAITANTHGMNKRKNAGERAECQLSNEPKSARKTQNIAMLRAVIGH